MLKHLVFFTMLLFSGAVQSTYAQTDQARHPSKQCEAMTQKGTRCKNRTKDGSPYCHVHRDQTESATASSLATQSTATQAIQSSDPRGTNPPPATQCKAQTRKGDRCKRAAKIDGFCTQHHNMYVAGTL